MKGLLRRNKRLTPPRLVRVINVTLLTLMGWSHLSVADDIPPAAAIATAHPLATEAGTQILAAGGNAFDAAIAISAALAVVEPAGSGLGGGGFYLLHRADNKRDIFIDARETAPGAAHADMYLDTDGQIKPDASTNGPLAAGIPGVPAALAHLAKHYGRLPLKQTLGPAIAYAKNGFVVDEPFLRMIKFRLETLRAHPAAAAIFLHQGGIPPAGFMLRQPELADTLEQIAQTERTFYTGAIARKLVDGVRAAGGIWTNEDLAAYRVVEREPLRGKYRGHTLTVPPPPSSGGIALLTMLNILSGYDLPALNRSTQIHLTVESMRRAYRDRAEYLGDPDFVTIPIARLIHPWYSEGLRATLRLDKATPSHQLPGGPNTPAGTHTTHFSVLDAVGHRVAATLSINLPFGSGFVAPGTGVLLNNEMDDFSAKPGTPNAYGLIGNSANAIAPGKRPLSSMTPMFLESPERIGILGTPGGSRIITMVLHGVLAAVEGAPVQEWVGRPRYHHQFLPDVISYETGALTENDIQQLTQLGHSLKAIDSPFGNMQAVSWDKVLHRVNSASDPRGRGHAVVILNQADQETRKKKSNNAGLH